MSSSRNFIHRFDWILFGVVLSMLVLSSLTFYGLDDRSGQFLTRHIILILAAIGIMFLVSFFDYRVFKNYSTASVIIYVVAIILLGLAFASQQIRGISGWIVFNQFTFQPAEFAKLAVLILLAKYFSQKHVEINNVSHIIGSAVYVGLPLAMVFVQPDFGSAVVFGAIWLTILIFSGIDKRKLLSIIMLGVIAITAGWFLVLKDYQKNRILSFSDPTSDPRGQGYHLIQSKIAIGSGGWGGDIFNFNKTYSTTVPEPYTDFIFTSYAHKFGFIGVIILVGLLLVLTTRLINIASHEAQNNFSKFFTIGFLGILMTHFTINIGMNLGLLPITGIPLPFLSYGGSHLITMMAGLGMVQSIKIHG